MERASGRAEEIALVSADGQASSFRRQPRLGRYTCVPAPASGRRRRWRDLLFDSSLHLPPCRASSRRSCSQHSAVPCASAAGVFNIALEGFMLTGALCRGARRLFLGLALYRRAWPRCFPASAMGLVFASSTCGAAAIRSSCRSPSTSWRPGLTTFLLRARSSTSPAPSTIRSHRGLRTPIHIPLRPARSPSCRRGCSAASRSCSTWRHALRPSPCCISSSRAIGCGTSHARGGRESGGPARPAASTPRGCSLAALIDAAARSAALPARQLSIANVNLFVGEYEAPGGAGSPSSAVLLTRGRPRPLF